MKPLHIAIVNLKRMLREGGNLFFVFIFPIALVLLIGVQFGGRFAPSVGIVTDEEGELAAAVVSALGEETSIQLVPFDAEQELIDAIETGRAQVGVVLPAEMEETVAAGAVAGIGYLSRPDGAGPQLQGLVAAVVADVLRPVGAARYAAEETGATFDEALEVATEVAAGIAPIDVEVTTVGEAIFPETLGRFDLGASSQLVLFVFLTAIAGSSALILTRQLGISRRMLSTPTPVSSIVFGESLGRFATALLQGVYIMVLTLIVFGVDWGDPLGATVLLIALSAVGAGAGMLMGATFSNDQQAGGVGVVIGLGMAALGGAMLPLELFSPTMQRIAHVTPHAWALDGFAELVRRGGGVPDILPELGVLAAYALVLFALASWRLRVAITRP